MGNAVVDGMGQHLVVGILQGCDQGVDFADAFQRCDWVRCFKAQGLRIT